MFGARTYSSVILSTVVHAACLVGLWFTQIQLREPSTEAATFDSVVSDDAPREMVTQQIDPIADVAENLSATGRGVAGQIGSIGGTGDLGGNASGSSGGGRSVGRGVLANTVSNSSGTNIRFGAGDIAIPSGNSIGDDLKDEIRGDTGAPVASYEAALGQITQEVIRLMREKPVLIVWMFDESESMQDDQKDIRSHFHKVYEELGILSEKEKDSNSKSDVLLTMITSFGQSLHSLLPRPTSDINEIRGAIDKIPVDESGLENMCASIESVIDKYRNVTQGGRRRLAVVVVTDESGDDGDRVEAAIAKARSAHVPIYILGREAIFGYPYARLRWTDPVFNLEHWLPITRGPETANPECLQWDGLHSRWDSYSSGFGPYEQVRLASQTSGIFFVLPGEEQNLTGAGAAEKRKFDMFDMKRYEPDLGSRQQYEKERNASPFRTQIWNVILTLNPFQDEQLNIRELYYPAEPAHFQSEAKVEFDKAVRGMKLADQATVILEKLAPLRAKESSPRWRAAYDLAYAQCLAYRVRLFQFILALDQHAKKTPKFQDPKSNVWNVRRTPEILPPDPEQVALTRIDLKQLNRQEHRATELFTKVIDEHPRTPWANRAKTELDWGFGMKFVEHFRDPNYDKLEERKVKLPKF